MLVVAAVWIHVAFIDVCYRTFKDTMSFLLKLRKESPTCFTVYHTTYSSQTAVVVVIFLYSPTRTRRFTPSVAVGDSEGT